MTAKRAMDLIGAGVGLLLASPIFIVIALAVKLDDGGPVFYSQERVGYRGRRFRICKFRTMRVAAASAPLTVAGDARVTRVGQWLRRFKLDELPQLLHVVKGEMSLVGPRPEVPRYVAQYSEELLGVLDHKPGITDPASVEGWDEGELLARAADPEQAYLADIMPAKIRRQLRYASRATIRSDLLVLLGTISHPWDAVAPSVVATMVKYRRFIIVGVHIGLICASYWGAFELRFDFAVPPEQLRIFWLTLPALLAIRLVIYGRLGLYSGFWKHFSIEDLFQLVLAVTVSSAAFTALLVAGREVLQVPRSVLLLDWLGVIFLGAATHLVARSLQEGRLRLIPRPGRRTLVIGAGDNAERLVRAMFRTGERALDIAGLVVIGSDRPGRSLHGVPIVGTVADLPGLVSRFEAELVVIALEHPSASDMERVVDRCVASRVEFRTLPPLDDMLHGTARPDQLRPVELTDLLGRAQIELDPAPVRVDLAGKHVLVTGGAGSIGSELARQVAGFHPARLIVLDQAESGLFYTHLDLVRAFPDLDIVPVVCDVTDEARLTQVFSEHRPHYVVHSAAYKHVPLMEANPLEAVRNNVLGTLFTARAAANFGASKFVLISTDKAVNPASVMGATKQVAERVVLGLPAFRRSLTDFRAVRFGNVLGSAGSVVPLFERQLARGEPLTVTHPDAERYFMTVAEAAQLVLQAAALRDARGRICMLDMGEPVRIVDLARKVIALSGSPGRREVPIVFTGLRPGEKLREDLTSSLEVSVPTEVSKVRIVLAEEEDGVAVSEMITRLLKAQSRGEASVMLQELAALLPDYAPAAVVRAPTVSSRPVDPDPRPAAAVPA